MTPLAAYLFVVAARAGSPAAPPVQVVRVEADGAPIHPALVDFLAACGVARPDLGLGRPTMGTGVRLADGRVLTADHGVHGASRVRVHVPGLEDGVRAELVRSDWRADLAVLRMAPLPGDDVDASVPLPQGPAVAWSAPEPDQALVLWGHAGGGVLRSMVVQVAAVGRERLPGRPARPLGTLASSTLADAVARGDSGGPVIAADGTVAGVLVAGDADGGGRFVPGDVVGAWLGEVASTSADLRLRWGVAEDARVRAVDGVPLEQPWPSSDRAHLVRLDDGSLRVLPPAR